MSDHPEQSLHQGPHQGLRVSDFDFHLPEELIAQQPPDVRGSSRMLVLDRNRAQAGNSFLTDQAFADLPSLLEPGDLLIFNDSRVIPARLYARRTNSRGQQHPTGEIEVLLTSPAASQDNSHAWKTLVRPGRKVRIGDHLDFPAPSGEILLRAQVIASGEFGERILQFDAAPDFYGALEKIGHMPLPPYIHRQDGAEDRERYQTIYAAQQGSVAAPTAGLHFTPEILATIAARGVQLAHLTLHVGLGTFAPLRVDSLSQIRLHSEPYTLPAATADALNQARSQGSRIVAVGTTAVRTLEHCALIAEQADRPLQQHSGETSIFLSPGHRFRLVDAMLTNFHLPQSSLLMLVSAFAGRQSVLQAYQHAVQNRYRFFSYGDCMFIA